MEVVRVAFRSCHYDSDVETNIEKQRIQQAPHKRKQLLKCSERTPLAKAALLSQTHECVTPYSRHLRSGIQHPGVTGAPALGTLTPQRALCVRSQLS